MTNPEGTSGKSQGQSRTDKVKDVNPIKRWYDNLVGSNHLNPAVIRSEAGKEFTKLEERRQSEQEVQRNKIERLLGSSSLGKRIVSSSLGDILDSSPKMGREDERYVENQRGYDKELDARYTLEETMYHNLEKLAEAHIIYDLGRKEMIVSMSDRKRDLIFDSPHHPFNALDGEIRANDWKRLSLVTRGLARGCWQISLEGQYRQMQVNAELQRLKIESMWGSHLSPLPDKPVELSVGKGKAPEGTNSKRESNDLAAIYSIRLGDFEVSKVQGTNRTDTRQSRQEFFNWFHNRNQKFLERLQQENRIQKAVIEVKNLEGQLADLRKRRDELQGHTESLEWIESCEREISRMGEKLAIQKFTVSNLRRDWSMINAQCGEFEAHAFAETMRQALVSSQSGGGREVASESWHAKGSRGSPIDG
jgi:hypothetical protein